MRFGFLETYGSGNNDGSIINPNGFAGETSITNDNYQSPWIAKNESLINNGITAVNERFYNTQNL